MIRGKLPTERNLVPRLPSVLDSGIFSRMQPGEKVILELEVVKSEYVANSYVDFVSLSSDVNFSGMFKAKKVTIGSDDLVALSQSRAVKKPRKLDPEFYQAFDKWADEGNIPLETRFSRRELMESFKVIVPVYANQMLLAHFCGCLTTYANRIGYLHNSKIQGKEAYSLIIPKK